MGKKLLRFTCTKPINLPMNYLKDRENTNSVWQFFSTSPSSSSSSSSCVAKNRSRWMDGGAIDRYLCSVSQIQLIQLNARSDFAHCIRTVIRTTISNIETIKFLFKNRSRRVTVKCVSNIDQMLQPLLRNQLIDLNYLFYFFALHSPIVCLTYSQRQDAFSDADLQNWLDDDHNNDQNTACSTYLWIFFLSVSLSTSARKQFTIECSKFPRKKERNQVASCYAVKVNVCQVNFCLILSWST